jgi:8-oxo-dGTP diphosphatase
MVKKAVRVAAYAVCISDENLLLARWVGPQGKKWTMPGGGVEHGEDPYDAVIREVAEETGYTVEIDRLLGVHSTNLPRLPRLRRDTDVHSIRLLYRARVVGGRLRPEQHGSTDLADWIALDAVRDLDRVPLVDIALALDADPPPHGRLPDPR